MTLQAKRKPRGQLNRETVVKASLELIDRDGVEALTMRRLSDELGVGTMTVYRHVTDRADLLQAVAARLIDEIDVSSRPAEAWQDTLRRVSRSYRSVAQRHPRAMPLRAVMNMDADQPLLAYIARLIDLHCSVGFSEDQAWTVFGVFDLYCSGFALIKKQAAVRNQAAENTSQASARLRHPLPERLSELLTDAEFDRGVDLIIAGIETSWPSLGKGDG